MIQLLFTYLTLNALVAFSAVALALVGAFTRLKSQRSLLRLHYAALALTLAAAALPLFLPRPQFFQPVAKVWSAPSIRGFSHDYRPERAYLPLPGVSRNLRADHASLTLQLILAALALAAAAKLDRDFRALSRQRRQAFPLRQIGRVKIYAHETLAVPFSFRSLSQAEVFLPAGLLTHPENLRLALKHELQHHRQGDTLWAYAFYALRTLCAPNPAAHFWARSLNEIQEFACDEAVLGQRKVNSQAYARCLFEVAEQAFHWKEKPTCAMGFFLPVGRRLTVRRIERMTQSKTNKTWKILPLCAALALALTTAAFAARSAVQDKRVTSAQAEALAEKARLSSAFPIVVNELVVAELNRFLGTPEGREFIRASLERMEGYRALVEGKIAQYDMPTELLAIPLVESGYENLPDRNQHGYGAGLWMFIASTARNYGLRVDSRVDERLNPELLTDAAMRYWRANFLRFGDWQLSALAYNMGEAGVQKAINETGSRDAFTLVRKGYEGDKNYLARVVAAILILKNPETLK